MWVSIAKFFWPGTKSNKVIWRSSFHPFTVINVIGNLVVIQSTTTTTEKKSLNEWQNYALRETKSRFENVRSREKK